MALGDDIAELRDRVLADLNASHDYFVATKVAWAMVRQTIAVGRKLSIRNQATGTTMTPMELAAKSREYVAEQLAEATFQQFVSIFESFLFDFLRLWLLTYPQSLAGRKVDFKAILDAPDKDAIIDLAVAKELGDVLYDRPTGWFAYLEERAKLGCPTPDEIDRIAEAKASRDVLVHSRGVASKTYAAKAGRLARCPIGQRIEITEQYHREAWELLRKVVRDVSDAAIAKMT
jgi:hypothetical protein